MLCIRCKEPKELLDFYLQSNGKPRRVCKSCVRKIHSEYDKKNKDKLNSRRRKFFSENREVMLYNHYRVHDRKRNLEFDLSPEWIKNNILNSSCIYCGTTYNLGCDRIDNSRGHTMDNVVPSCKNCNLIRQSRFSISEMKLIGNFLNEKIYSARSKIAIK